MNAPVVGYEVLFPRYGGRAATSEFVCPFCLALIEDTPEHPTYDVLALRAGELEPTAGRGAVCDRCDGPLT